MVTRRGMLRWVIGMGLCLPLGMGSTGGGLLAKKGEDQEPDESSQGAALETWMNEWMSIHRAPGGILKLSRFREPIYFLIAPISWAPNPGQEPYAAVTVPTGFVTDLASIPKIFWSLLRPDGEYAYAAIVHDYLYWQQTRPREEADAIFKMAMEDFEIHTLTVQTIYRAVRAGGAVAWKGNAEKKAQGERRLLMKFPQDPRTRWADWKLRPGVFGA